MPSYHVWHHHYGGSIRRGPRPGAGALRGFDISYIFAGEKKLDCALALCKLKELFRIDRLLLAGGAVMNASLLHSGLIDELSVLMAPVVDIGAGAPLFRRGEQAPAAFALKDAVRLRRTTSGCAV